MTGERLACRILTSSDFSMSPRKTSLGSLKLGGVLSDSPVDSSIININTGDNGKARPNDFNTVTVTIQDGGVIREVASNIRWIQTPQTINASNIYTPEEALSQFLSHNAKLSLTIPAGEGRFNYDYITKTTKPKRKRPSSPTTSSPTWKNPGRPPRNSSHPSTRSVAQPSSQQVTGSDLSRLFLLSKTPHTLLTSLPAISIPNQTTALPITSPT